MFATVLSRAALGIQAPPVIIEADIAPGLPSMTIIGLPEASLRESKDRVRSAILNANFEFPAGRIVVNLAPADLPKDGGRFDLAIALALLAASGQLPIRALARREFYGELSLAGHLRPTNGILPAILRPAKEHHIATVPMQNLREAQLLPESLVVGARHLREVCELVRKSNSAWPRRASGKMTLPIPSGSAPDLADVRGQGEVKRALEIVAAGGHNILLCGPPGIGKTMLATRLPGILPPMTVDEAIETAVVASLTSGGFHPRQWGHRPFRSPHHTTSPIALVGGGSRPMPGEVSLAHNGVLLLDELPEFSREAIEALREPLETATVAVARAAYRVEYPARFQLIATMNPCPCGYRDQDKKRCRCTEREVERYRARISAPFLDRLDVRLAVKREEPGKTGDAQGSDSSTVLKRVATARQRQIVRQSVTNARLDAKGVARHCTLTPEAKSALQGASNRLELSPRALQRVLKVSRSIADLDASEPVTADHLSEALLLHSVM